MILEGAQCLGMNDMMFPPERVRQSTITGVCWSPECPVRKDCLEFALRTNQDSGVWGGHTTTERRRMRVAIRKALT